MTQGLTQIHTKRRRRKRSRYPYTKKEKWLVILTCLQLTFALWSMALTHLWEQFLFTSISIVGLAFALTPQFYAPTTERDPRLEFTQSLKRLLHYPIFWLGLTISLYLFIQWLNPSHGYTETVEIWRAFPISYQSWLPSGLDTPFLKNNALRFLLIFSGVWMMQCYLKVGIVRRNSLITILWVISIHFILFGILIIAQKQTGATGVYWNFPTYPNFIGSIPYNNRAAAILNIGITLIMALYFLHLKALRMELKISGPHIVVLLAIVFVYGLLWTTQSTAGLIIGSLQLSLFILFTVVPSLRDGSTLPHKIILSGAMLLLTIVAVLYTQRIPDSDITIEKMGNLHEEVQKLNSEARSIATQITLKFSQERWLYGWGAMSWKFVFPYYQTNNPEILYLDASQTVPAVWGNAHNDWVQYFSEFGIIGSIFFLAYFCWPIMESLLLIRTIHLTQVILAFGLLGVFLHAIIDSILQNQSILAFIAFSSFLINRLNTEQIRSH